MTSTPLRIAVITSIETRHRHFANAIRRNLPVAAVVYARPTYTPAAVDDSELTVAERGIVAQHFAERARQEEKFFGHDAAWIEPSPTCPALKLEPGQLNSGETFDFLRKREINTLVVFGTDLIKVPLLAPQQWDMINMHLGLSPYYRGTATNFYPLLNEEPQFVGATIHRLDAGIDSGPILHHARPTIEPDDRPHTIGCKAIAAGIEAMIQILEKIQRGQDLEGVPQWHQPNSRLYLRRDYHPKQVVELYKKWDAGLLRRFQTTPHCDPKLVHFGSPQQATNTAASIQEMVTACCYD